jgi:antitoxin component YwqK of YwqJK toxin-antitoxin module
MWHVKKKVMEKIFTDGKWKEFNKQAILVAEGNYKDGRKDGCWKYYYDTGEPVIEEHFIEGRLHGRYTSFYTTGGIMAIGQYVNDSREGKFYLFDENGALSKVLLFNDNTQIEETIVSNTTERGMESHQSQLL